MRFRKNQQGSNISDKRGRGGSNGGGSLLALLPMVYRMLGLKGTIVLALVAGGVMIFKPDLISSVLNFSSGTTQTQQVASPEDKEAVQFINNVKHSNDTTWKTLLGGAYREPTLHIDTDRKGTGPYYMPSSETIHIDPQFFVQLATRLDSPGDFAHAYVLAHETAHHVQKIFGLTTFVHKQHGSTSYNDLSVRLELYADFLSGVWAHNASKEGGNLIFDEGDLEEAINAANNIGDDVLQKKAGAWKIDPSKFTHGTGEQRKAWLLQGFRTGDFRACHLFQIERDGIKIGNKGLMP